MDWNLTFFLNSILFGIGLAVDAFLISLSNGLNASSFKGAKIAAAALVFALFQLIAPMVGWVCVHTVAQRFEIFAQCLSWLSLFVLLYIGIKMLSEGLKKSNKEITKPPAGLGALLVQALITSVDALSVGFAIADYTWQMALIGSVIIAFITFCAYTGGFCIGRRFGAKLANKAQIIGGIIFIVIGIEVFISGLV